MKIINYTSFTELGEEVLEVQYEDGTWERIGYLWDAYHFFKCKGWISVDFTTFSQNKAFKYLVNTNEIAIFVESLQNGKGTII